MMISGKQGTVIVDDDNRPLFPRAAKPPGYFPAGGAPFLGSQR